MHYFEGDQPIEPVVVVPARDGDPVDLELYSSASARLVDGAGTTHDCPAQLVVPAPDDELDDDQHVAVTLPLLEHAGLAVLTITLETAAGGRDTFEADGIPVERLDGWHTIASAHLEWPGSADLDDVALFMLLETARIECAAYAPRLAAGVRPPVNYRRAQLTHARNRNAASRVDPASGDSGTESYSVGAFPLDWVVKQQLRPERRLSRIR